MIKKTLAVTYFVALSLFAVGVGHGVAAYVQTLMNDGTNLWFLTSVSNQLTLQDNAGAAVITVDPTAGIVYPLSTVAALPACSATYKGSIRTVSDATSPTYNGALTGGSTVNVPVFCNGTAWLSH